MPLLAFLPLLGLDTQCRRRPQQQALQADGLASVLAPSVLTPSNALQGFVDLVQQLAQLKPPRFPADGAITRVPLQH